MRTGRAARLGAVVAALALVVSGCATTVSGHGSNRSAASSAPAPSATSAPAPAPTTGGSSPTSPAPTMPTVSPISFTDCSAQLSTVPVQAALRGQISYGCAKLSVPLNYADPSAGSITLQLIKIHDRQGSDKIGSLLVNPGGPGGSGVDLALGLVNEMAPTVFEHFDVIGFDPRGVGLSSPISCISSSLKDTLNAESPDVLTTAGFAQAKALAARVAQGCSSKYGAALAQYNTVNTARDMDLIRQAVGDKQMNYLGFSYGTELGAAYAHLFPNTIRVAVLDGAVDPLTSGIEQFADQLKGFEGAFDQFATWCGKHSPCEALRNPRTAVYDIVAASQRSPLSTGSSRRLTSSLALTGVLDALYSQSTWSQLGKALIQARGSDGAGLLALADDYNQRYNGQYTNIMDANLTISCNDEKPGPTDATIRATAKKWSTEFPMFGKWAAISLFGCQDWQPVRTPPPLPSAATTSTVLVIGNTHDPATPYQGAIDLTKTLGHAELLTWDGEGHTSYLQGSSCVDDHVNNYLIKAELPSANTTCPR